MSTAPQPETPGQPGFDPTAVAEQSFARLSNASEKLVKTLTNIVSRQFELGREYMEGNVGDFTLLSQARTPEALIEAELEVVRRRSERAIAAVNTVTTEMRQAWIETFDFALPKGNGKDTAKPAKAAKTEV
jgi:hypothetical protein